MTGMRSLRLTDFNQTTRESNPTPDLSPSSCQAALIEAGKEDPPKQGKRKEDQLYASARAKAYRMLSYRDRSSHEIAVKLREKAFSEEVISTVVSDLKASGALNDKRFAEQWMRYQIENRHLGPHRLKVALLEKGFSPPEVARLLECLSGEWDPVRVARRALLKRYKALARLQDLRLRRKAFSFLQRKGFCAEDILTVFRKSGIIG